MALMSIDPGAGALRPRGADGWRQGMIMALVAHGLLLVALMFSVNWRPAPQDVVEAEMWAEVPTPARPDVREAQQAPPPAPEPAPAPPPPPPPPAQEIAPPPAPVDLAVRKEPPKPVKPKVQPREEWINDPPKPPKAKVKPLPEPPTPKPAPAPPPPKAAETPKPAPGPTAAERERARKAAIDRMMADLGGPSLSAAGPSAEYAGRIKARVKPNIVFTESVAGNPLATVEVRCAPDGRIIGSRLVASSGVPAWDEAVLRAIERTEVLPRNEKGQVPSVILLDLRPKDF